MSEFAHTSLDQLLAEVTAEATAQEIAPAALETPDAIVQIEIITKCRFCGSVHTHPNPHLLGRFGRRMKRIKMLNMFYHLPREADVVMEESERCDRCWEEMERKVQ